MNNIKVIEIQQIYNFIAEYPEVTNMSNIHRIHRFISEYFYGKYSEINISDDISLLNIKLVDGTDFNFDIKALPNFLYKEDFLTWCKKHLLY